MRLSEVTRHVILGEVARALVEVHEADSRIGRDTAAAQTDNADDARAAETRLEDHRQRQADAVNIIRHASIAYAKSTDGNLLDPEYEPAAHLLKSVASKVDREPQVLATLQAFAATPEHSHFVIRCGLEQIRDATKQVAAAMRSAYSTQASTTLGTLKTSLEHALDMLELFLLHIRDAAYDTLGTLSIDPAAQPSLDTPPPPGPIGPALRSLLVAKVQRAAEILICCDAAPLSRRWVVRCQEALRGLRKAVMSFSGLRQIATAGAAQTEGGAASPRALRKVADSTFDPSLVEAQAEYEEEEPYEETLTPRSLAEQKALLESYSKKRKFMWDLRARLATFSDYPISMQQGCNPSALAAAGFFHAPLPKRPDGVACCGCGVWLCGWDPVDSPLEIHRDIDKSQLNNCTFLKQGGVEDGIAEGAEVAPVVMPERRASQLLSASGMGHPSLIFDEASLRQLYDSLPLDKETNLLPVAEAKKRWGAFDPLGCPVDVTSDRAFEFLEPMCKQPGFLSFDEFSVLLLQRLKT